MRWMISSLKTWAVRLKGWRGKRQRLWLRLLGYYLGLGLVPVLLVDIAMRNDLNDSVCGSSSHNYSASICVHLRIISQMI